MAIQDTRAQPNETQKALIAKLVNGQKHAGYQVWNKDGIASVRIREQSKDIVAAIKGQTAGLIKEENKDDAKDKQDKALKDKKDKEEKEESTRQGGLFSGLAGLFKDMRGSGSGSGGGFFSGLLGFGKGFFKGIGKVFSILGLVLKWIGGPLLLIGSLAFLSQDEAKQREQLKNITEGLTAAWEFLKTLGGAFGEGVFKEFNAEGGLKSKLNDFSDAWGGVFKLLTETPIGEGQYQGLSGVANWLGVAVTKFAGGLVDLGTLIAKLITDPEKTIGELQGKLFGALSNLGTSIAQVFDDFFSADNLSQIFQDITGFELSEDTRKDLAARENERLKERMKAIDEEIKTSQRIIDEQNKREKEGKSVDHAFRAENISKIKFFEEQKKGYEADRKRQLDRIAGIQAEIEIEEELGKDLSVLQSKQKELKNILEEFENLEEGGGKDSMFFKASGLAGVAERRVPQIGGKRMSLTELLEFIDQVKAAGGIEDRMFGLGGKATNAEVERMLKVKKTDAFDMNLIIKEMPGLLKQLDILKAEKKVLDEDPLINQYKEAVIKRKETLLLNPQALDSNLSFLPNQLYGIPGLASIGAGNAGQGSSGMVINTGGNVSAPQTKINYLTPQRDIFGERQQIFVTG